MTTILLLLAIPLALWALVFMFRAPLLAGCVLLLLVMNVFNHFFLRIEGGPVPLTLDRIVLACLVAMFFIQWRLGRTAAKPLDWGEYALFALVGWLVISTVTSEWRISTPDQTSPMWRLLAGYLIPLTLYWIARQAPLGERALNQTMAALACFGIYLAVVAVLEVTGQWGLVFPRHIADPKSGLHFGRARGPMLHAPTLGFYLTVTLFMLWMWRQRMIRPLQLAVIALVPLFFLSMYYSYTRMVWIGAAAGVLVYLAMTLRGVWRPIILGGAVAALLVVGVAKWDSLLGFRREYTAADTRQSAYMRACFTYVSWQMFRDHPLVGVGFGQFPEAKKPYLSDRSTPLQLEVIRNEVHHNVFLSLLTETGLIGLALALLVFGRWTYNGWNLANRTDVPQWASAQGVLLVAVMATWVCHAMLREMSYGPEDHALLFFLAGIVSGLKASADSRVRGPLPQPSPAAVSWGKLQARPN